MAFYIDRFAPNVAVISANKYLWRKNTIIGNSKYRRKLSNSWKISQINKYLFFIVRSASDAVDEQTYEITLYYLSLILCCNANNPEDALLLYSEKIEIKSKES